MGDSFLLWSSVWSLWLLRWLSLLLLLIELGLVSLVCLFNRISDVFVCCGRIILNGLLLSDLPIGGLLLDSGSGLSGGLSFSSSLFLLILLSLLLREFLLLLLSLLSGLLLGEVLLGRSDLLVDLGLSSLLWGLILLDVLGSMHLSLHIEVVYLGNQIVSLIVALLLLGGRWLDPHFRCLGIGTGEGTFVL